MRCSVFVTERRRRSRRRFPPSAFAKYVVRPNFQPRRARILDLSASGVGLLTELPVDPGAVLAIQFGWEASPDCLIRRGQVERADRAEGRLWVLGCSLEHPLTVNEMAAIMAEDDRSQ